MEGPGLLTQEWMLFIAAIGSFLASLTLLAGGAWAFLKLRNNDLAHINQAIQDLECRAAKIAAKLAEETKQTALLLAAETKTREEHFNRRLDELHKDVREIREVLSRGVPDPHTSRYPYC